MALPKVHTENPSMTSVQRRVVAQLAATANGRGKGDGKDRVKGTGGRKRDRPAGDQINQEEDVAKAMAKTILGADTVAPITRRNCANVAKTSSRRTRANRRATRV